MLNCYPVIFAQPIKYIVCEILNDFCRLHSCAVDTIVMYSESCNFDIFFERSTHKFQPSRSE